MNRWRTSVDEIQARKRQVTECERALEALCKVTACFQQMAISIGSNSDGSFLREEMDETRALAHRICTGLHRRLVPLLTERATEPGQEDRLQVQRLWVLFLTGLENLQQDLHKASDFIDRFPLKQRNDRRALVNTGATDGVTGVSARAASVQTPWLAVEVEQNPDLKTHITQIDVLVKEMLQKVSIPFWAVEATQEAWVEGTQSQDAAHDQDETLEEMMVVSQDDQMSGCCQPLNCKLGCMFCLST
ncbi:regulator of G-protein signaling 9-binding protein [Oncorhynchus keta]|uniref:regulator of G-protein signaling 9-binding protein n=1 Tax=Oncorhynchus keta TaxID=8018 RepID=UPI0015F7936F|nr:regulator of G-protein signaling 9-binding protein [Oncorhynchus keta]XP_035653510.1 regulator of G-protein signaling 9-binding protein [Oncorhynchus keta]XP_035653511.1 regulator of G-protein signaling 9-binding protein [Oncorhynchus keta]XP_052329988.1 regulator of G-protein signaling 9-binding protein [Oncorhynchus keta]XP_052329989.1 regulator of G-protein signaling 9-binding protein [Oncorhynchus keta]